MRPRKKSRPKRSPAVQMIVDELKRRRMTPYQLAKLCKMRPGNIYRPLSGEVGAVVLLRMAKALRLVLPATITAAAKRQKPPISQRKSVELRVRQR